VNVAAIINGATYADTLRGNTRMTWVGDQSPPRAVGIRRSLSPAAIARSDVAPAACSSAIVGARSAARASVHFYGWFTEGFDTIDLKEAKALLDELAS
jgi:hypothetical protein